MKNKNILVTLASMALAMLACALPVGDGSLFKDDFSGTGGGWGVGTDEQSSVEISNGEMVMQLFLADYFVWSVPGEDELENIHVEVTAKNTGGGVSTAFGVICNYQTTEQFYYFLVTSNGEYAIAKTSFVEDDVFLTNEDTLGTSADIPINAESYRIGTDCANGTLTLYVDGKQIDSVSDSTFTKGDVGLFTWTGNDAFTEIHFDDFVVTSLAE